MRDNQAVRTAEQKILTQEVDRNRELQKTLKKRFTETQVLLTQIPKLPKLLTYSNEIKDGQLELYDIVQDDIKLLPFVVEIESNTLRRINDLIKFFNENILIGTDFNQISIATRLKVIDAILFELIKIKSAQNVAIRKLRFVQSQNYVDELLNLNNRLNENFADGINRSKIVEDALPKYEIE